MWWSHQAKCWIAKSKLYKRKTFFARKKAEDVRAEVVYQKRRAMHYLETGDVEANSAL